MKGLEFHWKNSMPVPALMVTNLRFSSLVACFFPQCLAWGGSKSICTYYRCFYGVLLFFFFSSSSFASSYSSSSISLVSLSIVGFFKKSIIEHCPWICSLDLSPFGACLHFSFALARLAASGLMYSRKI